MSALKFDREAAVPCDGEAFEASITYQTGRVEQPCIFSVSADTKADADFYAALVVQALNRLVGGAL